ncbi:MAG: hypothetical protein IT159_03615 [Bryobacterales bacterium]|nr:hypothetical protein [Bryobacterales bacterium]
MNGPPAFVFYTERRLVLLTGFKAGNLPELLRYLRRVSGASIFYHTHHQYLSQHFEKPLFHNDFAKWTARALLEDVLAEKLTAIDLLAFSSIRQLRERIIAVIEEHITGSTRPAREARPDDLFHFCESMSFLMPTGIVADSVDTFFDKIRDISNLSLFCHFFEARLRLDRPTNDFSLWLRGLGEEQLASRIERLDPYAMTLDELRDEIVRVGESR